MTETITTTTTTTLPTTMIGAFLKIPDDESATATTTTTTTTEQDQQRAHFELRETKRPILDHVTHPPGTVLLKTIVVSICGSDFVGKNDTDKGCSCGCRSWRKPLEYLQMMKDMTLDGSNYCGGTGHEILGEVMDCIQPCKYTIGERLLGFSAIYMKNVIRDVFQEESGLADLSVFKDQGGFAQYFISHDSVCLQVPTKSLVNKFDPLWFVTAQPIGTVINACQRLPNIMNQNVAIVGQGQNGLLFTQLIAGYRPKRLIVLDRYHNRLQVAIDNYNITHTVHVTGDDDGGNDNDNDKSTTMISNVTSQIHDITNGEMCDVVIDAVGHQKMSLEMCANIAKNYGTVMLFGLPPAASSTESQFNITGPIFHKNLKFVTVSSPKIETFQFAIDLLKEGRIDPSPIITHTVPFEPDFPKAYDMAQDYQDNAIKEE